MSSTAPIRILGVAGSLREASFNRRLTQAAARLLPDGVELVEFHGLARVEPYDTDVESSEGLPAGAAAFAAAIRDADAVFIATPEYNGSVPGQLKNALDWASRSDGAAAGAVGLQASPLFGRPVAVASASTGQFGGVWARDELSKVIRTQGGRPIVEPSVTVSGAATAFAEDGTLASDATAERLRQLLEATVDMVRLLHDAARRQADAASPGSTST